MEYPLISEYREAILSAEDNFNELASLRPVLDSHGDPVMSSGNFAVVFKMKDEDDGKFYAVKCFIKDQEGRNESYRKIADELEIISSSYILPLRYLENELFVDSSQCDCEEFPVVVMEWVEGETLDAYLKRNLNDKYELEMLSYRFNRMAAWLLAQPFAHGDLKPDNILIRKDDSLVLVDYDGMFVPSMKGEKAREIGSPDYRHPLRTDIDFNEHIDDFSISAIALSLKAIALNPQLKSQTVSGDTLLLSEKDFRSPSDSTVLKDIQNLTADSELQMLLGIFYIAMAKNSLDSISFRLFITDKPKQPIYLQKDPPVNSELIDTTYTEEDIKLGIADEFGFIYSRDGKKLLKHMSNNLLIDDDLPLSEQVQLIVEHSLQTDYRKVKTYTVKAGTIAICDEAFYYCNDLECLTIPNSVRAIGRKALLGCMHLNTINIPDSVTYIGTGAFLNCSLLKKISIPNSLTSINNELFSNCKSLQDIHIPDSVTSIGNKTFYGCQSLRSIVLPDSVTSIGDEVFSNCSSLESVNLPTSISYIGKGAFAYSPNIRLVIPSTSSYKVINDLLIDNNGVLISCLSNSQIRIKPQWLTPIQRDEEPRNIVIPPVVTRIGNGAFMGCKSLKTITIPNSVTTIGESSFYGCKSLVSINLPDSISYIGSEAFRGCLSLKNIYLPSLIDSINKFTFCNCKRLISVEIPNSVINIDEGGFKGCEALTNISIPDSVTSIGPSSFYGCKSLASISLPDSIDNIGSEAFKECKSLNFIHIPHSITTINPSVFFNCASLQEVEMHDSIITIEAEAFRGCELLSNINIPESLTTIGDSAFAGCLKLKKINISNSITHIGAKAFLECICLRKINISDSIIFIGNGAFSGCSTLQIDLSSTSYRIINGMIIDNKGTLVSGFGCLNEASIPNNVTHIGEYAFYGSNYLQEIIIPESVTSIGKYAFSGCVMLRQVLLPTTITIIAEGSFSWCESLECCTIPKYVKTIEDEAFYGCESLHTVNIPNSVISIGNLAFYCCEELHHIKIPKSVEIIGPCTFPEYCQVIRQ